ncbi:class E sortase [Natranaerofaba carboxydovora]|uniref:class E sortase n=1 Tax=Natranaerofaba carboxydovora TaxID=2742683 RepID=UPI001F134A5C|nr:class E sortase [Natranaerofaba carboxydovora]UMZ74860.1 Sortase family protein [Natranaerofaba carboxydovora]
MKKNKIAISTLCGIILLLAGILITAFPYFHNLYYQRIQARQVEETLEQLQRQDVQEKEESETTSPQVEYFTSEKPPPKEENDTDEREGNYAYKLEETEGVLEIPALNLQFKVGYGVELPELESGPGFYPHSNLPEHGNVSVAGHRTTYGAPFGELNKLEEEDNIKLYFEDNVYIYKVDDVFATDKYDWSVIEDTSDPALTLTTCEPPGSSEKRLIVRAYLED